MTPRDRRQITDDFFDRAPTMAARGWAVIPCQSNRMPARVGPTGLSNGIIQRECLRFGEWTRAGTAPTLGEVEGWAEDAPRSNTAILLGSCSHGVFAIDLDIDGSDRMRDVLMIVREHLGLTDFERARDKSPRRALLYRMEHVSDLPPTRTYPFADERGSIEVLSTGRHLQAYGRHHTLRGSYVWTPCPSLDITRINHVSPFNHGPEHVPVVTPEQLRAFIDALDEEIGIAGYRDRRAMPTIEYRNRDNLHVLPVMAGDGVVVDEATGLVTDGRERFLFRQCSLLVRANPGLAVDLDGRRVLAAAALGEFKARCERVKARFQTDHTLQQDISCKIRRIATKLVDGDLKPIADPVAYAARSGGKASRSTVSLGLANARARMQEKAKAEFLPIGALGEWLAPAGYATRAVRGVTITGLGQGYVNAVERGYDPLAAKVIERAIPLDVRETSARVTRETTTAISSPLVDLLTPDAPDGVTIVRGLPGTGKTTTLVKALADIRKENGAPLRVLMVAPAHRNLAEIADAARAAGLVVRVLRGRGAVCSKPIVARLEAVGVSPGGACAARTRNASGELVRVECPTRSVCPAYTQYADLDQIDLILAPHAYLTMTMDKSMRQALQMVRAVVVDEGFTSTVLDAASLPLSALRRQRVAPPIYKIDTQVGWTAAYLLAARNRACQIALDAFDDNVDLAARFADLEDGEQILYGAIATASRGDTRAARVDPSSDVLSLAHILDAEETHGREEARMWRIVDERRRQILAHRENPDIVVPSHEARIRIIGDTIRLAWRADIHFQDRPWLCLDGSADGAIVGRILGRPVRTVHVRAPLRQHVTHIRHTGLSGTALRSAVDELGRTGRSPLIEEMAEIVAQVARQHRGEVLVVVRGAAEEALKAAKRWPERVRFGHHNGLRGLNTYEASEAVVILGSILPSPDALDDLAAALSYDDADPEPALVSRDGAIRWVRQEYSWPMRDGSDASAEGPGTRGVWHERMLAQLRDEDLVQNAARGRQVHRQEPMALYLVGDHVPHGTTVDLVVTPRTVLEATPMPKRVQKPRLRVVA